MLGCQGCMWRMGRRAEGSCAPAHRHGGSSVSPNLKLILTQFPYPGVASRHPGQYGGPLLTVSGGAGGCTGKWPESGQDVVAGPGQTGATLHPAPHPAPGPQAQALALGLGHCFSQNILTSFRTPALFLMDLQSSYSFIMLPPFCS